jgi:hypothetical protein
MSGSARRRSDPWPCDAVQVYCPKGASAVPPTAAAATATSAAGLFAAVHREGRQDFLQAPHRALSPPSTPATRGGACRELLWASQGPSRATARSPSPGLRGAAGCWPTRRTCCSPPRSRWRRCRSPPGSTHTGTPPGCAPSWSTRCTPSVVRTRRGVLTPPPMPLTLRVGEGDPSHPRTTSTSLTGSSECLCGQAGARTDACSDRCEGFDTASASGRVRSLPLPQGHHQSPSRPRRTRETRHGQLRAARRPS